MMATKRWWALVDSDGKVVQQIAHPDNPVSGKSPQISWDGKVREIDRPGDLETERLGKSGWEAVPERVEAQQLRVLDSERQQAAAKALHPHRAIAVAHDRKAEEARSWLLLTDEQRAAADLDLLFPWLLAEAGERKAMDDLARTILTNRNKADAQLRAIDAAAVDAKRRLRDAETAVGKRRIAGNWKGQE